MQKFDVELEMKIKVELENPEAIQAYFIDGDWGDCFYPLEDLEEFIHYLVNSFQMEPDSYSEEHKAFIRAPEGFGVYIRTSGGKEYTLVPGISAAIRSQIKIVIEDALEVYFVTELGEEK